MTAAAVVYLVDDDRSVLKAITRLLVAAGLRVVAFDSPQEFLLHLEPSASGCLVLDVSMPGLDGMQLQQALLEKNCALPVIFLSGRGDIPTSVQAMKRGAVDFLTKPVDDSSLLAAVHQAVAHDAAGRAERVAIAALKQRIETLTPRERQVLGYVIAGRLNKQIAAALGTTEKTVKVHRARLMEKMDAPSLAELVRLAGRAGIAPTS